MGIDAQLDSFDNYSSVEHSRQDAQITVSSTEGYLTETIVFENMYARASIDQKDVINTLIMNSILLNNAAS